MQFNPPEESRFRDANRLPLSAAESHVIALRGDPVTGGPRNAEALRDLHRVQHAFVCHWCHLQIRKTLTVPSE
jgi:tRNA (Thr-GGU) A37 N-methylase